MGWRPKPTKEQLAQRERWRREHVPRIQQAQRPNAAYITEPQVVAVLQHLADGVNQVLMARPLAPFPWLADYLRHACKVAYSIEQDAATVLVGEIHKKRRVIQNALLDTKADEVESKRLILEIISQQEKLSLQEDELLLETDDHFFLATDIPRHQSMWSIDVTGLPLSQSPLPEAALTAVGAWMETHLIPRRHIEEYAAVVLKGVTHALVEMEVASPENCAEWIVLHFRQHEQHSHESLTTDPRLTLFFKTNYELMRKIDIIKCDQREMHLRREKLKDFHTQLHEELACRQRFIAKLRVSHTTTRTHAIMTGTPCFLNSQKVWILPAFLLVPEQLNAQDLLGLRRAEGVLMGEDETRLRFLLVCQKQYDAATRLQAAWRCACYYRKYEAVKAARRDAAIVIQRNYFHYLYHRAISLPAWCVRGREVMVAMSVALKSAVTFQFYSMKDFPTGNFKRLEGKSIPELMEICRQDEGCAAFTTDGSLKRFVPRQLSQLKEMSERDNQPLTMEDGIYIKVVPSKNDPIVTTGIVIDIPVDRFGLVTVVLDGTGVVEQVPLQKLTDRWKRIRVRRNHKVKKKRMTFVVNGKNFVESSLDDEKSTISLVNDYQVLEEDDEDAERRERQQWRARLQSNEQDAEQALLDFVYEDQATKEVHDREPHCTYSDADERALVVLKRQEAFAIAKANAYEMKKLQSVIRLQCAWRSKRAREAFRQVLQLRAREKERDKVVQAVHNTLQRKQDERRAKQNEKSGFFGRWMRR